MTSPSFPPTCPPISEEERTDRRERACELLASSGASALILSPSTSLYYFTGLRWGLSERFCGCILSPGKKPQFVVPGFEAPRLVEMLPNAEAYEIATWEEHENPLSLCGSLLPQPAEKVLLDPAMPASFIFGLQQTAQTAALELGQSVVDQLRMRKSSAELEIMRQAMRLTLSVHRTTWESLCVGLGSDDIESQIDKLHRERGADGGSTFCIVGFGDASAVPHGVEYTQKLEEGQMVLVDTGCTVHGYHADLTRTYVFGKPTPRQRELWSVEQEAQQAGFDAAELGAPCEAVDIAARNVIEKAGFGPGYQVPGLPHRTGHGVGLDIHESPYMVGGNKQPLEPGMCASIEPMLSIPGEVGIRLEDHFFMTEEGARWFTEPSPSLDEPFGNA